MTPSTGDLPDPGQVIEFTDVPAGSLLRTGVRYRVEHKPGDGEYLLVDIDSGHAGRVSAHELKQATWGPVAMTAPEKAAASDARPLTEFGAGLLNLPPLPSGGTP